MTSIFLSYRRADTAGYAGRLARALRSRFGDEEIFQDIETIQPGSDFRISIDIAIQRCEVLLVLIGNTWLTESDAEGRRRLDDPDDFVRLEIATALRRGVRILPVLVEDACMPAEGELPPDLKALADRQALELSDSRWDYDLGRLMKAIVALTTQSSPRKRWLWVFAALTLAAVLGSAAYYFVNRPADIAGRWQLPNGSVWLVEQKGEEIAIDEVHYQSREVWKRGRGHIDGKHLSFTLDLVFQHGGPSYQGEADLAADGALMKGRIVTQGTGQSEPFSVTR